MILTVTCNPAVDVTYAVDRLEPGGVHRVLDVAHRPGGKGVNVARVLHQLGTPVTALGIADGRFATSLEAAGLAAEFLEEMGEVRRTLVVHDGSATSLWEPGRPVPPEAGERLVALVERHLDGASALVVSGSLPPGVSADVPARLATLARAAGVPAVLDLDGAALAAAVSAGGGVLTPNAEEFGRLVGHVPDLVPTVRALAGATGAPVVLTLGARGLLGADDETCWLVEAPVGVTGNPTGAGDAAAAGITLGLARSWPWADTLRHAVALGAAAVTMPTAGEVDAGAYESFLHEVRAQPVDSLPAPTGS